MSGVLGHSKPSGDKTFHYLSFPTVFSFDEFVSGQFTRLNPSNRQVWDQLLVETRRLIQRDTTWYGSPPPSHLQELEDHTVFLGMHLLSQLKSRFDKHFSKYLNHLEENVIPQSRIDYNDRGLGIFSFDRAAMGLFLAPKIDMSNPVAKTASQLKVELGKGDVQTRTKKVFTHFENRNNSLPSLRLFIGAGANANVEGDDLLYIGLACGELVEFLEKRGIPVEVNIMLGTTFSRQMVAAVVRIKAFEQSLDKNQLLLLSSDPRHFRYKGFKSLIALANHFNLEIPHSLGSATPHMYAELKTLIDDSGFVFEQSYSLDGAAKEVSRIIEEYETYRMLIS